MADLPTRRELFRRARAAAIATPGTQISPLEIDREGSDANLIFGAITFLAEELVIRLARECAASFEDTATGDELDRVVFDRKGLPRLPAAKAVGEIQLTRPTNAAGAGSIQGGPAGSTPAPTRIRTNQGIVYILTQPAIFGAADLGPVTVTVEAESAGLAGEVAELQAWAWMDPPFDGSIVIANAEATAGASDEETDADYRRRAKDFFPTIRRGVIGAIEFGLRSTPGVASVSVIEATNPSGLPAGLVQGFVLDALGRANQTLAARAQRTLLEYRAAGIPVQIIPGTPEFVEIEFAGVSFDTSLVLDTSQAAEDVRSLVVAALNNQRSGEVLLRSTILAAARRVPGFLAEDTHLVEPAGTLVPASSEAAFRTRRELIRIS